MITLHVPQPQVLLTPLVFYNMHAIRLQICEIPGSYNVFDMSDLRLKTSQSSLLSLRGAIFLIFHWDPLGKHALNEHHITRSVSRLDLL